ncbi:MAG: hypothetical protein AB7O66_24360 [Limisphaerales bacterium]
MRFRITVLLLGLGLVGIGGIPGGLSEAGAEEASANAPDEAGAVDNVPEEGDATETAPDVLAGNPYRAIVVRNAFQLKEPLPPPPPPTNAPPPPEQPKVDVKLAGLAEIKGVRYAYLMVPDADRPGQFLYPTLTDNPGQPGSRVRHQSLEVREIDIKSQTVRLVNGGIEATINFKDNGVKNLAAATPATRPGVPGQPAVAPRLTAPLGASPQANAAPMAEAIVFSRNPNRASGGNSMNGAQGGSSPSMINGIPASVLAQPINNNGSGVVVPTRPVRTTGAGGNSASGTVPPQPQITLEQEYQALIRQRQVADQQGIQLPPIPGLPMPTDPAP